VNTKKVGKSKAINKKREKEWQKKLTEGSQKRLPNAMESFHRRQQHRTQHQEDEEDIIRCRGSLHSQNHRKPHQVNNKQIIHNEMFILSLSLSLSLSIVPSFEKELNVVADRRTFERSPMKWSVSVIVA
jgi:hypothetical protein